MWLGSIPGRTLGEGFLFSSFFLFDEFIALLPFVQLCNNLIFFLNYFPLVLPFFFAFNNVG